LTATSYFSKGKFLSIIELFLKKLKINKKLLIILF
jgi:hypothetical protein